MPNKITIHWTGGKYFPNEVEKEAYHFLIDGNGVVHAGKYDPKDNGDISSGKYAAHTGMLNTGNIGVSMCGMFKAQPDNFGEYPLKLKQYTSCIDLVARLCDVYQIEVTPFTVFIHSEVKPRFNRGVGKWDVNVIPAFDTTTLNLVPYQNAGDYFREGVKRRLDLLKQGINILNKEKPLKDKAKKGWSSSYYELPTDATQLNDLINHKGMSWHIANIFKACYRYGEKEGTSKSYDLEKISWFVEEEKKLLEGEDK